MSVFPETATPFNTPATTSIQLTSNIKPTTTRNPLGSSITWTPEETATSEGGRTNTQTNLPATSGERVSFGSTTAERTSTTASMVLDTTLWSTVAPEKTKGATTITVPQTGLINDVIITARYH